MTWETIGREPGGRSFGVTVSWRVLGGRKNPALAVSLGKHTAAVLGLKKSRRGDTGQQVVAQRDRMAGKLRIYLATTEPTTLSRSPAWKGAGCTITVPLDDVKLAEPKRAQDVPWWFEEEGGRQTLIVRLPPWACPPVKVNMGRAA